MQSMHGDATELFRQQQWGMWHCADRDGLALSGAATRMLTGLSGCPGARVTSTVGSVAPAVSAALI